MTRICSWRVMRVVSISGCVASCGVALWMAVYREAWLRGYATFWTGAAAVGSLFFVFGYSIYSTGWRRSEEGSIILALVGLLSLLAASGFAVRVFFASPPAVTVVNIIVTVMFAWMMFWLSAVFVRRQVEARRRKRVDQ